MSLGRGDADFGDLERRLQAGRPQPSDLLQRSVLELTTRGGGAWLSRSRLAVAGILTALMLVAVAALGATSSAGTSPSSSIGNQGGLGDDASDLQYDEKVIICHRSNGSSGGVTLRVSREAAKAHMQHHEGDTPGPCADD